MSTLLFMALALVMAVCIARYNKSNALFWVMAISLMSTFAITSAVVGANQHRESKDDVTRFTSTQGSNTSSSIMLYVTDDAYTTSSGFDLKLVGKMEADKSNIFFTPSEYYNNVLEPPPQTDSIK